MATLSDVAKRAGVSVSAASRVLSGATGVRMSDATRERIAAAAAELDYRPNFAARALKFARTDVVALVVPDLTNAIFTELMRGVEEEAQRLGYMVLLARAEALRDGEDSIPRLVGEGRIDGVLIQVGDSMAPADLRSLLEGRVPAVLINSSRGDQVGSVILEDALGARIATQHLIDLGHTEIGLINGVTHNETAVRRRSGFEAAMTEAGLRADRVTSLGYEPQQGRDGLRELMSAPEPPTAVVVSNVNAAVGALAEARVLGLEVPRDLSIAAIHDSWTAENTWPPLTTVRMPLYELGRAAMRAVYERMSERRIGEVVVSERAPELMLRLSTSAPRGG